MIVMKFGGTSVADFNAVRRTIGIIKSKVDRKPVVCVSALSGVTDMLYRIADTAAYSGLDGAKELIATLRERHLALASALLSDSAEDYGKAAARVNELCDSLSAVVGSIAALGEIPDRIKAVVISFGELLSSSVICFAMNRSGIRTGFADARQMIITDGEYLKGVPNQEETARRVTEVTGRAFAGNDAVITQGFIAATSAGAGTVLGRGGSDYSAAIIGAVLGAERIEIWTDVDGIRSSDPRVVPHTRRIDKLSFSEAAEMAAYGAKVLHPMTIAPAVQKNIPIYVLNSLEPEASGTVVVSDCREDGAKAVAFKRNIYAVEISGISETRLKTVTDKHRIKTDIFKRLSDNEFVLTADFTQNIFSIVEELAAECDVTLRTGLSQVSVIGSGLYNIRGILTPAVPEAGNAAASMETSSNFSFTLPRDGMEYCVRKIHRLLFGNGGAEEYS